MLLRSDNVDVLAVVDCLADEGNVLETEDGPVVLLDVLDTAEGVFALPVESTLSEDGADQSALVKILLALFEQTDLGMRRRAHDDDLGAGNDFRRLIRALVDLADEVSFVLPVRGLGVGFDLTGPHLRASRE